MSDPRTDKSRAAFHQELLEATIKRRKQIDGADFKEEELNTEQLGYLAAKVALKCDTTLTGTRKSAAMTEAMRILCAMLGKNPSLALQFKTTGIEVVIVSADRLMTSLPEFASLGGVTINQPGAAGAARGWDQTRGVGGLVVGGKMYAAVMEENLVGGNVGPVVQAAGGGCYSAGYSTTSHEFAHALHMRALDARQKQVITESYKARLGGLKIHGQILYFDGNSLALQQALQAEWVDGPRMALAGPSQKYKVAKADGSAWQKYTYTSPYAPTNCYAAVDEKEYFAQCVNAYLGANGGNDPYTRRPRNNGATWIRLHEPKAMVALLDELFSPHGVSVEPFSGFGTAELPDTNVAPDAPRSGPTLYEVIAKRKLAKQAGPGRVKANIAMFEKLAKEAKK